MVAFTPTQDLMLDVLLRKLNRADAKKAYSVRVHYLRVTSADPTRAETYEIEANNKSDAETLAQRRFCNQFNIPWKMIHMLAVKFL